MYMHNLARRMAKVRAREIAYIQGEYSRTWAEIHERGSKLAAAFQNLGLSAGERVGIIAHDRIEMIDHWHGCLKAGLVRTGINWRYSPREMSHIVRDAELRAILVQDSLVQPLSAELNDWNADGRLLIGFGDNHGLPIDFEDLIERGTTDFKPPQLTPTSPVALSYTSGSTGLPQGAILTQLGGWTQLMSAPYAGGFRPEDVILNNLPGSGFPIFIHTMGMSSGATTVLPGLFTPQGTVETIKKHNVSVMFCVPTMLNAVEEICRSGGHRLPSLRLIIQLGSPVVPAIVGRARATFNCEFQNWYGSTEGNGAITMMRNCDLSGDPEVDKVLMTSVGRPLPHVDIEIRDDDDRPVPAGEPGEICVRGPVIHSYHNLPEETAHALRGGWFHMGDIGYQNSEGHIFLSDRKHFMIVSGGYNVYPAVVENVLASHPSVGEVAVVGAAHSRWGEAVVAVVVAKKGLTKLPDPAELVAHCADRVGKWEVPKHIEFVDALPVGTTGKIQKRDIREWFRTDPSRLPWSATDNVSAT